METARPGKAGLGAARTAFCALPIRRVTFDEAAALLRRAPSENFLAQERQERMRRIEDCIECEPCKDRWPYDLDPPELLKKSLPDYETWFEE